MNPLRRSPKAASRGSTYALRVACYFFLFSGILALSYAGFVSADSHAYQTLEMRKFERASRLPEPRVLAEGDVIGEIQVPRLGINAIVVQGDSSADLRRAVGHLSQSALPGETGNVTLAAHRDTFFRPLRDIRLGDKIRFATRGRDFDYRVEAIEIVAPGDRQVLQASSSRELTLVTCYPFYYVGSAPKRFVVRACEVDAAM